MYGHGDLYHSIALVEVAKEPSKKGHGKVPYQKP